MSKILIIEDDPIIGHIYRTRLEKEGFEAETCTDGQSGFYRIHEFRPDAVLLDLMLPKMNGVDILKKIRAQSQFQGVPIIVFTNAYVPNMIQEAFGAGATQVFNKATLTPRQIVEALQSCIGGGGAPVAAAAAPPVSPAAPVASTPPNAVGSGEAPYQAAPAATPLPVPSPDPAPVAEAAAPPTPAAISEEDAAFQAELVQAFQDSVPDTLAALRKCMQDFTKAPDDEARMPHLLELYRKVHAITGSAGLAGLGHISQMSAALEVLLKELNDKPKNINASTVRTLAHSLDFLSELFKVVPFKGHDSPPFNILVVDDEILSRRAITYALEKANLKSASVEDPQVALNLATESEFDLIFLDVQMPGMDGFDLCAKIRALPKNKVTPIIFVTSLTDFKSRARSSLSGGTDLIAKPFMFIELSVKALTYVLRGRLKRKSGMAAAA